MRPPGPMAPATPNGAGSKRGFTGEGGESPSDRPAQCPRPSTPASPARSPRKGSWSLPCTGPREALRGHRVDGLGSLPRASPAFALGPGTGSRAASRSLLGGQNRLCSRKMQPRRAAWAQRAAPSPDPGAGVLPHPRGAHAFLLWGWAQRAPSGPLGPHRVVTQLQGGDSRGQWEAAGPGWGPGGAEARR